MNWYVVYTKPKIKEKKVADRLKSDWYRVLLPYNYSG